MWKPFAVHFVCCLNLLQSIRGCHGSLKGAPKPMHFLIGHCKPHAVVSQNPAVMIIIMLCILPAKVKANCEGAFGLSK